jgi:hypothetical protein
MRQENRGLIVLVEFVMNPSFPGIIYTDLKLVKDVAYLPGIT